MNQTPKTITTLHNYKKQQQKITCLTAYDASFAALLNQAEIDIILVGDSLGNVIQGQTTTIPVNIEDMIYHTACVSRGNNYAFIMSDMPFMTYATPESALENATLLMQAGAHMVKLEGGKWLTDTVRLLTERGIPVCAHLGLLPQSIHKLGGYKAQGKESHAAEVILEDASQLEQAGAQLIVLEYIPETLGEEISRNLSIPTIGIGAGLQCDGQVLVLYDILGISLGKTPAFSRNFFANSGANSIKDIISAYVSAVKSGEFPR